MLSESRQLKELDLSKCEFYHPKSFFDFCQPFVTERTRCQILKLRGINISHLEGKVLQLLLMKNKSLHTIDISEVNIESSECIEHFFLKMNKNSVLKHLIIDKVQPDLN